MKTLRFLQVLTGLIVFLSVACNEQERLVDKSKEAFYLTMEGDTSKLKELFHEDYFGLFQDRFSNEILDARSCLENYYFDEDPANIKVYQDSADKSLYVIDLQLINKIDPKERAVFRYYFHGKDPRISSFYVLPELISDSADGSSPGKGHDAVQLK